MSLADSSRPSLLPPFLPFLSAKKSRPSPSRPFDEALIVRLKSLLPIDASELSVPLAWLARAAGVLAGTLADAAGVVSDPSLSGSDKHALAAHLDASVALLDAANAASAELDRLLRRRLILRLALHLLPSPKARGYIAEWESEAAASHFSPAADLIKRLTPRDPPRGKISAVRRAIYAVEAVSCLVAGGIAAVLGRETADLSGIRISTAFPWAEAYNEVVSAISGRLATGPAGEVEAVAKHVRGLAAAMDDVSSGEEERAVNVRAAAEEAERAVGELTAIVQRLSDEVNAMFHAALSERSAAMQCFRLGPQKCK